MAEIISIADLPTSIQEHELVNTMISAANAKASRVAPCLGWDGTVDDQPSPTEGTLAEARLVLIGMVKRWAEASSGAYQQQTAGPFGVSIDTRQRTGYHPWPSEIEALQEVCSSGPVGRQAFSIDTAPSRGSAHLPWCDLNMGGASCSCGANLTAYEYPLYEGGALSGGDYY